MVGYQFWRLLGVWGHGKQERGQHGRNKEHSAGVSPYLSLLFGLDSGWIMDSLHFKFLIDHHGDGGVDFTQGEAVGNGPKRVP